MPTIQMGATMNNKTVRVAAALALAAGAAFAVPSAAYADADTGYTDPGNDSAGIGEDNAATFGFEAGAFTPGGDVAGSVTGENASEVTAAIVKAAIETNSSLRFTAAADGSLNARLVFPENASGTYTLTFTDVATGRSYVRSASVAADGAAGGTGGSGTGGSTGLPATGLDSGSLLGLWVGGGALVLAGGAIAVGTTVRRARHNAA